MRNEHGLTPQQETFAVGLAAGEKQTDAYRAAYPRLKASAKTIAEKASRLAADSRVQARVKGLLAKTVVAHDKLAEIATREWSDISLADARELSGIHLYCCRYCWGKDFRYQRTAGEMEEAREAFELLPPKKRGNGFDEKGGIGYHAKRDPNPDCPECFGDGMRVVYFNDTRRLSRQAARLFAGVKETKDGLEVKVRSQDGALENLGRVSGVYEKDNKQKADPLTALLGRLNGNIFTPVPDAGKASAEDDDD